MKNYLKFYLSLLFTIVLIGCVSENLPDGSSVGEVTDIDGNIYNTVKIGTQVWTVENLRTTRLRDGSKIPNIENNQLWVSSKTPAYCFYNNDINNKSNFGALYNWHAVETGKLAPAGWHVPTNDEWKILENYIKNNINEILFTKVFGGYRNDDGGVYEEIYKSGIWWSSTEGSLTGAYYSSLMSGNSEFNRNLDDNLGDKKNGRSVRCIAT